MYKDRLKKLRLEKNLIQDVIANILGIDRSNYGHYERELDIIPLNHLINACNYFNVSLDYIFNFTNKEKYINSKPNINLEISSKRLKEFRKSNKLTQTKLAKILNCSTGTIAGYEISRYIIATPFLYTICKKYHVSADYLLGKIDYIPKW